MCTEQLFIYVTGRVFNNFLKYMQGAEQINVCMYPCIHLCIYVCMHACMHVCMYGGVYIYIISYASICIYILKQKTYLYIIVHVF